MKEELVQLKKNNSTAKVGYSRVVTNKMSIIAWRLYKSDRILHFSFLLYRLKRDFGFTDWELANFTGMPISDITNFLQRMKPLLKAQIVKKLAELEYTYEEAEHEWRSKKLNGKPQGYYEIKDRPAWYNDSYRAIRWRSKPPVTFGEDEKGLIEEITKAE